MSCVETDNAKRLRISSRTAAPIIAFAAGVVRRFISRSTSAVIATLVAARAVPTKRAVAKLYP